MFDKLISSLGLQGVKVDTILHTPVLQAGQTLQGEIHFQGASSNKNINGIYLNLMTTAEVEAEDHESSQALCLARWHVSGAFELQAHQVQRFPFQLQLPYETPITEVACRYNATRLWLHTHLDVDWGLDANDRDYIKVTPTPAMNAFLQAMQHCGYQLHSVDVEKGQLRGHHFHSTLGCYQELEFKPIQFLSGINEVEVSFVAQAEQTHVLLEIDRKFRGDHYRSLTIPHQHIHIPSLVEEIQRLLQR